MKAALYKEFKEKPKIEEVADPTPGADGVVIKVEACGICRSDWHGWMGNDPDIVLPHVPGHELAGIVAETGKDVKNWKIGDRVTVPFVGGCGDCPQCISGNQQVCDFQFQPGFTAWGAFAEYVAIDYADQNLVRLPGDMDFITASSLGCRFMTSFRAVTRQARVSAGDWVAVFGCGGVGLSAIMIAAALGAKTIAVDIEDDKLEFAKSIGAAAAINSKKENVIEVIKEITLGGASVSIDALGNSEVASSALCSLQKRGRHVQIGLLEPGEQTIPLNLVVARELEIIGSHGMQAHRYPEMFEMIGKGALEPQKLVGNKVTLEESIDILVKMNEFSQAGVNVINRF